VGDYAHKTAVTAPTFSGHMLITDYAHPPFGKSKRYVRKQKGKFFDDVFKVAIIGGLQHEIDSNHALQKSPEN